MCESKGRNLRPNSATASGYYQIIASTWKENGGDRPYAAWKHSKADQDRVARNILRAGGLREWECRA